MTFEKVGEELPALWEPKDGESITGVYKAVQHNVGKNKSNMYTIEVDGELKNFWGSIGGRIDSLVKNAEKGHKKKRIFGTYEAAIGFADPATLAATAAPILAAFTKFLKSIQNEFNLSILISIINIERTCHPI